MKFIYTILLFMIFLNVFTVLFTSLGIMPYGYTNEGDPIYVSNATGEEIVKDLTKLDFEDATSLALDNADLLIIAAGGIAMAILMRSPAPFAVGLFLGIFINTYRKSTSIFSSFDMNQTIVVAGIVGFAFVVIITMIEYFTHGDV